MKFVKKYLIFILLLQFILFFPSCKKDLLKLIPVSSGTFTDSRDGKTYKTTTIGNYTWLAQNLDFATGSSCYYNNDTLNKVYGRLYTWTDAQAAVPPGWHLPTYAELDSLYNNLGGNSAGNQMVVAGDQHWLDGDSRANNYSGLTVLPGGEYNSVSTSTQFNYLGSVAYFWEMNESLWNIIPFYAGYYFCINDNNTIIHSGDMFSIRCVKDY